MATSRPPWRVTGAVLFSHGDLSYEVDLTREFVAELAQSRLGERTVLAFERKKGKLTRPVIVRSLPPTSTLDPEALARMRARLSEEARLATYLQDPRIARVLGQYEVEGVLYVVSERVEGASLNTLISYSIQRKAFLSPAFCLYVGAEIARALHHAHTRTDESGTPLGIVHRDVNPTRVYLGTEGEVVLTDFARARSWLPGRVATTVPRPGGEVFYCSPEALLGQETEPRSDLFSLGLVLLELATWHHLYNTAHARPGDLEKALTPAARKQVLHARINALGAYESLPDYAEDCILRAATFAPRDVEELTQPLAHPLRSIVRRLLQRKAEERYASAAELETDLRAGLASLGGSYGPREALAEVYSSLDGALRNRSVVGPTSENQLPPVFVTEEDIITAPGGAS
jgi:serine/threonine protein kinase